MVLCFFHIFFSNDSNGEHFSSGPPYNINTSAWKDYNGIIFCGYFPDSYIRPEGLDVKFSRFFGFP